MKQREQIYAEIPKELHEAEELLREYGRWARGGSGVETCGSIERNYRNLQDDEDRRPSSAMPPRIQIDKTHRALIAVPELWRLVLMWVYVNRSLERKLRMNRIPARIARERHLEGVIMFRNLYREINRRNNHSGMVDIFADRCIVTIT